MEDLGLGQEVSKKGDGWGFSTINMGGDVEVCPMYVLFLILVVGGEGYSFGWI